jgi:hypothetical protein
MRATTAILFACTTLASFAQVDLKSVRARVMSYNTNVSSLNILTNDGDELELRWNDSTVLRNKLRKAKFSTVSDSGQDVMIILDYRWREALDAKRVDLRYGYIYDTRGELPEQLPNADKPYISGLLLPTEDGPTLKVGDATFTVRTNQWSRLLTISPTIIESSLLSTDDVTISAERVGNTLYAKRIDFFVGEWKPRPQAAEPKVPKVITHRPGYDPPGHVNHMPAIARGVGFSRVISRDFGPLPKAVNVIRRSRPRYNSRGQRVYNTRDAYRFR